MSARGTKHLLILAGALLTLAGCHSEETKPAPRGTPITAQAPTVREVANVERSVGVITSPELPLVKAEATGRVIELLVDAGSKVTVDQPLARLDDEVQQLALKSARASLRRAEVQRDNAQTSLARLVDLRSSGAVSQGALDDARAAADAAVAQVNEARAAVEQAQWALRMTTIKAPIAGIVQQRRVAVGDLVRSGDPVIELAAASALRAVLPFPETFLGRIQVGQQVRLVLPDQPDTTVDGQINELRPIVGRDNRAIEAIVAFPNPGNWKPGGSVVGEVILEARPDALTIPIEALVLRPAGELVYVLEDDKVKATPIAVGVRTGSYVEVLSGLDAGQRVAVKGAGFLTDGALVQVREE
ncbi:MAG: efflux RND transporter periplasmic adaptor subunit [Rhodanobacteraceae bacterium]|nr:efflux RND transporter periplasmic adaptor subunit [Rhodanobacteraceae bacterium]